MLLNFDTFENVLFMFLLGNKDSFDKQFFHSEFKICISMLACELILDIFTD
jgi:hypothetical protein